MPTTRPTDTPEWASSPSGGAVVTEPPSGLQVRGWLAFNKPPAAFVNWSWNRFASWVAHYASTASSFPTLQAAAGAPATAPLVVGDSCLIDEVDGAIPGDTVLDVATTAGVAPVFNVTSGGQFLVYVAALPQAFRVVERDGSAVIRTWAPTNALTSVKDIITDGVDVIAAYDDGTTTTVECWDITTGIAKWTVTPLAVGQIVNNIAIDDERVYIVGDDPGAELKALDKSTGATVWSYDHSGAGVAALQAVDTNGRLVFVAGAASGHASGATLRGVVAVNGFDFNGEGGNGTDAVLAWDIVQAALNIVPAGLKTDGRTLFVVEGSAVSTLSIRGPSDGVQVASRTLRDFSSSCRVDQDYVIISGSGEITAVSKESLAEVWVATVSAGLLDADGTAVFTPDGLRIARGNHRPTRFRRVDPTSEKVLPLRQVLVPVEFS